MKDKLLGLLPWRRTIEIDPIELSHMESYLQNAMRPVQIRPEFVEGLRMRLLKEPLPKPGLSTGAQYLILGAAGVLSSVVIIIAGIRATVLILGALGLLRQMKNQVAKEGVAPPHAA